MIIVFFLTILVFTPAYAQTVRCNALAEGPYGGLIIDADQKIRVFNIKASTTLQSLGGTVTFRYNVDGGGWQSPSGSIASAKMIGLSASISPFQIQFNTPGEHTIQVQCVHSTAGISLSNKIPVTVEGTGLEGGLGDLGSGCLIATATFNSELSPQVQKLRELRDGTLLQTNSGSAFMESFNQLYYSFSPTIADWERQSPVFKELVKITITPLITSLSLLNYVDIDSEESMLSYGISVILLNIGMYFVAPFFLIYRLKKL